MWKGCSTNALTEALAFSMALRVSLCSFNHGFDLPAFARNLPVYPPCQCHNLGAFLYAGIGRVGVDLFLLSVQEFGGLGDVRHVGGGDHDSMNQFAVPIRADLRLHREYHWLPFFVWSHPIYSRRHQAAAQRHLGVELSLGTAVKLGPGAIQISETAIVIEQRYLHEIRLAATRHRGVGKPSAFMTFISRRLTVFLPLLFSIDVPTYLTDDSGHKPLCYRFGLRYSAKYPGRILKIFRSRSLLYAKEFPVAGCWRKRHWIRCPCYVNPRSGHLIGGP